MSEKVNVVVYVTSVITVFCMNYCIKGRGWLIIVKDLRDWLKFYDIFGYIFL